MAIDALKKTEEKTKRKLTQQERGEFASRILSEIDAEMYRQVTPFLKPEQIQRLKQISNQSIGFHLFDKPEVLKALDLTTEQKAKIRAMRVELSEAGLKLFRNHMADIEMILKEFEKAPKLEAEAVVKASMMFSESQKKYWKELVGEPFDRTKLDADKKE
jgi:hypothetical protein